MKNRNTLSILWIIIFTSIIGGALAQNYIPGKLYVKVSDPTGIPQIVLKGSQVTISMPNTSLKNTLESYGVYEFKPAFPLLEQIKANFKYGLDSVFLIKCTGNQETLMDAIIANQNGEYEIIEMIPISFSIYTPNDYHLLDNEMGNDSALDLMKVEAAWDITTGDPSIFLGMHEKGIVDFDHSELVGKIENIGNTNWVDPYHGTFVAGCMAVNTDNNNMKSGVGFNCNIKYHQNIGGESDTSAWNALYLSGVKVINISWVNKVPSSIHQSSINFLTDQGVLFIAGAGNGAMYSGDTDSTYYYPASYNNVLSVTSVSNTKHHLYWDPNSDRPTHTHNDSVDVSAPGRDVIGLGPGNLYGRSHGTSFSSPYVAGVAGLIYSINPCLSPQQVTQIIKSTTENIDAENPDYIGKIGTGLVDAYAAVLYTQNNFSFTSHTIANGQNIIWDSLMFCTRVVIEDGGILHINSNAEIHMADTAKIIVEIGGELIIDGGKITKSNCADFWDGIQVRGNSNAMQTTQNQGAVRLMNNAIIEYAEYGVIAQGMENGTIIPSSQGGIILATGAQFINNKTAIKINNYSYTTISGLPVINESVVIGNSIEINNDYFYNTDDEPIGVLLSSVNTVSINGNNFINTATGENENSGIGTYVLSSDASIKKYIVPNIYSGWDYGIKALGTTSSDNIYIDGNEFSNNTSSIYLSSTGITEIIFNDFNNIRYNETGLYLDECHNFIVEENNFYSNIFNGIITPTVGLLINNSGDYNNEIYRNTFDEISYAVLAQNSNRGSGNNGLSFKCNTFIDNGFDVSVTADNGVTNPGIAAIQGSDADAPDAPAGNIFSWLGPTGTFTDINNEEMHFDYHYHISQSANLRPEYYTSATVDVYPNYEENADWNENSCPSRQNTGGGGIGIIKGAMSSSGEQVDVLNASLLSLKDGGDTPALTSEVDNSIPPETMEIYNELIGTSPYISDVVVESAIIKEQVLPNAMLRDVMVANPQSAKNSELMGEIDNRSIAMPDYMKAQILQGKSTLGAMEKLESRISYHKNKRAFAFKSCINWYLKDTISTAASFDSLLVLLADESTIVSKYHLASLQIKREEIQLANSIIANMSNEFNMNAEEELEYTEMQNYFALLIQMQQDNLRWENLNQDQLTLLANMESTGAGIAKVFARNIRKYLGLSSYQEPYIFPDLNKSSQIEQDENELMQSLEDFHYISISPNPAKDYIVVEYILELAVLNAQLQITDLSGKVLSSQIIHQKQDQQIIDTRNYKAGNYLLSIIVDGKVLGSVQMSIIK